MQIRTVRTLLLRELAGARRSVEAYPDDASLWLTPPGLPNSGGTLVLHLAGNLQHFVGSVLGATGYTRNREAEFARRDVSREELLAQLDATAAAVEHGLGAIDDARLAEPWPHPLYGRSVAVGDFLAHLVSHTAYHLGQLDYHRRVVTGNASGVNNVPIAELPEHAGTDSVRL